MRLVVLSVVVSVCLCTRINGYMHSNERLLVKFKIPLVYIVRNVLQQPRLKTGQTTDAKANSGSPKNWKALWKYGKSFSE